MQTSITGPLLRVCFGKVHKSATPAKILTHICDQMAFVYKDELKADSLDQLAYYEGMIDAYHDVAQLIAPFKDEATFNSLLGFLPPAILNESLDPIKEQAA